MKGEEDKLFDDFLRKSVGNYKAQPSPAIWKVIAKKLPLQKTGPFPYGLGNTGFVSMIAGGIFLSSVLVYQWNTRKNDPSSTADTAGALAAQTLPANSDMIVPQHSDSKTFQYRENNTTAPEQNSAMSENRDKPPLTQTGKSPVKDQAVANDHTVGKTATPVPVTPSLLKHSTPQNTENQNNSSNEPVQGVNDLTSTLPAGQKKGIDPATPSFLPVPEPVTETVTEPENIFLVNNNRNYYFDLSNKLNAKGDIKTDPSRENPKTFRIVKKDREYFRQGQTWQLSVFIHPEWLNNPGESRYGKTRQSAGFTVIWNNGLISLQTGLGVSKEEGFRKLSVTYKQLLGTYNDLEYITFDTAGGEVTPTYYYSVDSVYDKQNKTLEQTTHSQYTYLQIPVLLGISKTIGHSTFSVRGGPELSLLINKNEPSLVLGPDQKVIEVSGENNSRLNASWRWYLGAGYSYALNDRFSLFFEPSLSGYFNTPYEKKRQQKENPLYLGIRSGIMVNLRNPFGK
ncbi:MAG: hypothetical protein NTU44_15055 [Bacteroidetes bacterium]|nr:hypothetical protein [Bacteroidota bacterium]